MVDKRRRRRPVQPAEETHQNIAENDDSTSFIVRKIEDPTKYLAGVLIDLVINERGVHVFLKEIKKLLYSITFEALLHIGEKADAVLFRVIDDDRILDFEFETVQGKQICDSILAHSKRVKLEYHKALEAENAALKAENAELRAENAQLKAKNAELEHSS